MVGGSGTPRVSIVMPIHNGARYLDAAIASVRAQSFTDWELICVDDASTDATAAIVARHAGADERVRLLANPRNLGLPATLNRGFAAARAPLHSWTSDDNLLRPSMLRRLVDELDARPDAQVAYASFTVIDATGAPLRVQRAGPVDELLLRNVVGAAFLYRAEVTAALGGYDEALFGAEDYDFWLRAARRFRFAAVDEDLYLYRRHPASLTDTREREIKAKVAALVLRELQWVTDRRRRADALITLAVNDTGRLRTGLVARAALESPAVAVAAAPRVARWLARAGRNRWVEHRARTARATIGAREKELNIGRTCG